MSNIKYLYDGSEVVLIKKIEEGYLVRRIWENDPDDEEDNDGCGTEQKVNIEFFPKVFDNPPTEKLAAEVIALNKEIYDLHEQLSGLKYLKEQEKDKLNKISKIPGLDSILNYLTGDFACVMFIKDLQIKNRQDIYLEKDLMIKMRKDGSITLQIDNYNGDALVTFSSRELAEKERRRLFIERLSSAPNRYHLSSINDEYSFRDLMKDPIIKAMWDTKMTEVLTLDNQKEIASAKDEIKKKIEYLKLKGIILTINEENKTDSNSNT